MIFNIQRSWTALIFFLFAATVAAQDFQVPQLKSHVNDYANVLPSGTERQLQSILSQVKAKTGVELVVLTVPSLYGLPIEQASIQVVDKWQLGTSKEDKGLLLFLSLQEKRLRIEVGQGLEGFLTDAHSKRIIDQTMVPLLKTGDYGSAILVGTFQMLERALPDQDISLFYENIDRKRLSPNSRSKGKGDLIVIILFFLFIIFGGRSGLLPLLLLGGMGGGRGGGFGGGGFGGGGLGGGGGFSGGGASGGW